MGRDDAEWLTAEAVAARTGWPLRTTQRRIARWRREGWVVVERRAVPGERKWRLLVSAASLARFVRGEPAVDDDATAAAAA